MNKKELVKFLGGTAAKASQALGYKNSQSIHQMKPELTESQAKTVIMRAKAAGIVLPDTLLGQ